MPSPWWESEPRTRAELEAAIGVESVEALHARRRDLWAKHARLYARVQTWDKRRKRLKALILVELHNSYLKGGTRGNEKKPAVDVLKEMAYTDPRYIAFIDNAEADIAAWAISENDIRDIEELINRDQRLIGFATSEARL